MTKFIAALMAALFTFATVAPVAYAADDEKKDVKSEKKKDAKKDAKSEDKK